jgi:hypothetical protein
MGSRNTDMSHKTQYDNTETVKSIVFNLLYCHFMSYSASAVNDWSVVKSNGAKVSVKTGPFVCCSLQSLLWNSSKLLNQDHNF